MTHHSPALTAVIVACWILEAALLLGVFAGWWLR